MSLTNSPGSLDPLRGMLCLRLVAMKTGKLREGRASGRGELS